MNTMLSSEIVPLPSGRARQFHPLVQRQALLPQKSAQPSLQDTFVKELLYNELDALHEATQWFERCSTLGQEECVYLVTYQSAKLHNLDCLKEELGADVFTPVFDTFYDTLPEVETTAHEPATSIHALMKRSKLCIRSMEQFLYKQDPNWHRLTSLVYAMICRESHLMAKARRWNEQSG